MFVLMLKPARKYTSITSKEFHSGTIPSLMVKMLSPVKTILQTIIIQLHFLLSQSHKNHNYGSYLTIMLCITNIKHTSLLAETHDHDNVQITAKCFEVCLLVYYYIE